MLWSRELSDAALIQQVLSGRHEAFSRLVERHLMRVQAVAHGRLKHHADVEDAVQETFVKAYQSLDTLKDRRRFGAWLAAIVRNVCTNLQRAWTHETPDSAARQEPSVRPDPETRELHALVRREIDNLDADTREILYLHYFAGLKIREMAETLGISPAAAGKRLDRARDALGQRLIAELGPALEVYRPREEQTKCVMAAVLGLNVPWATSPVAGTAAVTGLAGAAAIKWIVIAIALVSIAGLTAWQWARPAPPRETAATVPAPPVGPATPPNAAQMATPGGPALTPASPLVEVPAASGEPQLEGRIYDSATLAGIASVKVSAELPGETKIESDPSDASGAYALRGLKEGRWLLSLSELKAYPDKSAHGVSVNVSPSRKVTGADFALVKGVPVRGRVTDTSGKALADAHVHDEQSGALQIAQTDADGFFELWLARPGHAQLRAYSVKDAPAETRRGRTWSVGPDGLDGVELTAYPLGTISGIVKNRAGCALPGILVYAHTHKQDGVGDFPSASGVTDKQGAFKLERLFEDVYTLRANRQDLLETSLGPGQDLHDVALLLDAVPDEPALPQEGTSKITGRVLAPSGNPIKGAVVSASGEEEGNRFSHGVASVKSDDGLYEIKGLLAGLHNIRATHAQYAATERSAVAVGSNGIVLKLQNEPSLTGSVLQALSGEPVPDFEVASLGDIPPTFEGSDVAIDFFLHSALHALRFHDPAGKFTLRGPEVPAGKQPHLLVRAKGFGAKAAPVAAGAKDDLVVRLEPEGRVEGIVTDSRGAPVKGALVCTGRALMSELDVLQKLARTQTDVDGSFVVAELPRFDLTLTVIHTSYSPAFVQAKVAPGVTTQVKVILENGTALSGRVTLAGRPVQDASIKAQLKGQPYRPAANTRTDANGTYSFEGLPPGEYDWHAMLPNPKRMIERQFMLDGGQRYEVNADFPPTGASLAGRVLIAGATPNIFWLSLRVKNAAGDEEIFENRGGEVYRNSPDNFGPDSYRLESLPAGEGVLEATAKLPAQEYRSFRLPIRLAAQEARTLDIDFCGGCVVAGTVTGLQAGDISTVIVYNGPFDLNAAAKDLLKGSTNGSLKAKTMVNDGRFRIEGLEAGDYTLVALALNPTVGDQAEVLATARKAITDVHLEARIEVQLRLIPLY